jgi:hypothetical protein
LKALVPPSASTSTVVPLVNALAMGEVTEILPLLAQLPAADDLSSPFLTGIFVDQRHGGTKFDRIAGELGFVDDFCQRELVFQLSDPGPH